jgi:YggT family protein
MNGFKTVRDLIGLLIGGVEVVLIFRLILKLANADTRADVVNWIYAFSEPLLKPFLLAFPTPSIKGGYQLEFTTVFAIFGYAFLGYVLQELCDFLIKRTQKKATKVVTETVED